MKQPLAIFFLILLLPFAARPGAAHAAEAPAGQARIDARHVLRGRFTEERQMKGVAQPVIMTGHFTAMPGRGLIWGMEKPIPTSTIITPAGMAQDIGGLAVKLPAKNLQHIYDMVSGALAGDWSMLDHDFAVTQSRDLAHWHFMLVPRPAASLHSSYSAVAVSGARFVEHIVMTRLDGSFETLDFSDQTLTPAPLTPDESRLFGEVAP